MELIKEASGAKRCERMTWINLKSFIQHKRYLSVTEVSIQSLRFNIWRTINENSERANNFISRLKLYLMPPLTNTLILSSQNLA